MSDRAHGWLHDARGTGDKAGLRGLLAADDSGALPITTSSEMWEQIQRGIYQGMINSCAGVSLVHLAELGRILHRKPSPRLSALAAYWDMRALAALERYDLGAYMADGITLATMFGVSIEDRWPYEIERVYERPRATADIDAVVRTDLRLKRVDEADPERRIEAVLGHLSAGRLVWVGGAVTEDYEMHSGVQTLPPPAALDQRIGGHARVFAGHRRELGGTYTLKEWGSWKFWGTGEREGVCLGNVAAEWVAECPEVVVLMEVRDDA